MSEVIDFPLTPFDGFDAHAWIRAVEAAGGELRVLDDQEWSITATGEEHGGYVDALCDLLAQTGGPSLEARARSGAVHRALRWRERREK